MTTALCITGPTASGKSSLALELCRKNKILRPEIISMDSAQIYREIDIASDKPSLIDRQEFPHHLIDICDPSEQYSVARFIEDVNKSIEKIISSGGTPIIVGGTMMYLKRLTDGIADLPTVPADLRNEIFNYGLKIGWTKLHSQLNKIDPILAENISPKDSQRITRGLEVWLYTGINLTEWKKRTPSINLRKNAVTFNIVALIPKNRELLNERIKQRFKRMIGNGLIEEVKNLRKREELTMKNSVVRLVGVRQAWEYLDGKISLEEFIVKGEIATKRLAKHQLTWLKTFKNMESLDPFQADLTQKISICESLL